MPANSERESDFVELNRTFHELSEHAGKSDDIDISQVFAVRSQISWDELLKNPRTVILSEAGSGKTQEIRHVAARLRDEGKAAFFLRLELIPDDFEIAFEIGSAEEFDAWLASADAGWLLLDSVDEARLRSPQDFERAIRRLGKRIEKAKERVTLVLTGRTHAWRPKTDFDLCEKHAGYPHQTKAVAADNATDEVDLEIDAIISETILETEERKETGSPNFKIVALDDLSRDQVGKFAAAKGVKDAAQFLEEIERVDAWSFTTRPQDLDEVIAFWLEKGRIGNRLEIMENSVTRRLTERDAQRAEARPISNERVREGAMLLAAAATMAQVQTIRVPDGSENKKGLSPRSALPGWDDAEIAALLSRPIFDNAIYGTVRFHHRSVREYLTAMWLAHLLERPASRRSIEALLFRRQYGMTVLVPTMRPILPWLAISDDKIREQISKIAPEVIFEGGDPSALPLGTRRKILGEVTEKIAQNVIVRSATEYSAVQRFAQPDIESDIATLLAKYASNDEVSGFLVRMIWLGRLKSLLPQAKNIAFNSTASRYTRISAFRALREIGTKADLDEVRQAFLKESPRLNRDWLGELVTELEPTAETIDWILAAIEKSEDKRRHSVDRFADALESFVDRTPLQHLPHLLAGFRSFLNEQPFIERGYCEISQRFSWLMNAASRAVNRLIKEKHAHATHSDSLNVLYKFRAAQHWESDLRNVKVEFDKAVSDWRELNNASFWYDVETTREIVTRKKSERVTDYWQAQVFGAFWTFTLDDFDRVCEWMRSRTEQDDKLVSLSLAFAIYTQNGKPKDLVQKLKSSCASNAELEERLELMLNPPPQANQWKKEEAKWKQRAAARAKKDAEQFERDKTFVQKNLNLARDPKLPNPADISRVQWYLHEKLREKDGASTKWTGSRWRELTPIFGEEVAMAYREGVLAYWRRYKPVLRSEGAPKNTTPIMVIFGLTGLEIESLEVPNWLENLSKSDAEQAVRYALYEMNGFPSWFPNFYSRHHAIATKVILKEIEYELENGIAAEDSHYVLHDVSWSGQWTWNDLAPSLYVMLDKEEPKNLRSLQQILKIIQGSQVEDADVARLAQKKIGIVPADHLADWFAVWMGVDPDAAMPILLTHLGSLSIDADRTLFAMEFVTKLWGGRRSETFGTRGRLLTPQHLKALYFTMHEHIRTADDIDRTGGGVFSPGLRDDAQDARNRILQELNKIPGKDAYLALSEIAVNSKQNPSFPYLERLVREKAEQDADLQPWTAENVWQFHDRLDRVPRTHKELADLAVLRLLDLKDSLEEGDDSIASVVQKIDRETELRNFIGHMLREKAFGRYSIPQEEEMADSKKPDLRFHRTEIDAPVPVELKIADNWSGNQLFERLENQLAGDYLRDIRTSRGIFALVYRGVKTAWELPGSGKSVNFEELVRALQEHWNSLSGRFPGIDDITVIGIDLTRRKK
ncbi:MAG: hypothetical protein A4S14_05915 [Proteobacteria bacterium SG_bin9]|nr:MAG: hypothetical protein A4S14_05915 [Proteobacteria bacterium SG_bin9]